MPGEIKSMNEETARETAEDNGVNPIPANLAAWYQAVAPREKTFDINGVEVVVRYKVLDIIELLALDDVNNPVLAKIISSAQPDGSGGSVGRDPAAIAQIVGKLNPIMVKAIIDPPLLEQGHDVGISVSQIPAAVKMEIFSDLIGGDGLGAAESFRRKSGKSMVAR